MPERMCWSVYERMGLLERCTEEVGCAYLSDLRYLDTEERFRLAGAVEQIAPGGVQPGRVERRPGLPGRRGPRPFHRGGKAAAFAGAYPPAVSEMTILRQRHTRPGAAARRGNRKKGSSAL